MVTWVVGMLGAYGIAAIFIYVPIVAVRRGVTFGSALSEGMREGFNLFRFTLMFISCSRCRCFRCSSWFSPGPASSSRRCVPS